MKRSQMIKIIKDVLLEDDDTYLYSNYWPEKILAAVEIAGMLPPTIIVSPNSYNRTTGDYGFECNDWEPENEV